MYKFGPPPKRGRASEGPEAMCPEPPASWVAYSPSRNTGKVHAGLARSPGVTKRPCPGATGDAQATFNLCVCVYVLCHVHNHEPIFTFSRNAHTRQLFITVPVACVTRGSGSSSMRQRGYGHHGGMGRQPQTTPTAATGNDGAPQWYGTAAPDHTSRPQRTPIAMARQARRARRQPSSSCIRRT